MSAELGGRVAVVTGSGRGIGRAIAVVLGRAGAAVAVVDVDRARADDAVAEVAAAGAKALAVVADVCRAAEVEAMVGRVAEALGPVDVLVNNVGQFLPGMAGPVLEQAEETWDRILALNLKSTFLCCRAVGRSMVERRRGAIVNIASMAGLLPFPACAPYGAAKAGLIHFTRTLAAEVAGHNVRVNAIAPGVIATPTAAAIWRPENADRLEERRRAIPMGRLGTSEEIADAALYLASDAAAYVTGHVMVVGGGLESYRGLTYY